MKRLRSSFPYALIFLLGTGLTVLSMQYVRPPDCQRFCDLPKDVPCPEGSCRSGEQQAGFPLPILIDSGAGSSPTGGWGKLGPEDFPNPITPVLDVVFYAALLWLAWKLVSVTLGKGKLSVTLAVVLFGSAHASPPENIRQAVETTATRISKPHLRGVPFLG